MVDYSRWDRMDLDSDSDGGEAEDRMDSDFDSLSDSDIVVDPDSLMREDDDSEGQGSGSNDNEKQTVHYANGVYEGQLKCGRKHGSGIWRLANGDVYDGEWKDDKKHGRGTYTASGGGVYEGQFVDGKMHGKGAFKWTDGNAYDGEWKDGKKHGKGTMKYSSGNVYEGQWWEGEKHGRGALIFPNGNIYEGEFVRGLQHGRGTQTWKALGNSYEGQWVEGKRHGKGVLKFFNGGVLEQSWTNGERTDDNRGEEYGAIPFSPPSSHARGAYSHTNASARTNDAPPSSSRELSGGRPVLSGRVYGERQVRSQKSQLRRPRGVKKTCEHCGVDDGQYKLRVCSGCNLALYCSAACQKAASGPHRRICDIISELPPRDADGLGLAFDDREKRNDFDAGLCYDFDACLRYATKYMDNLKHLTVNVKTIGANDPVKLSAKQLSSLLRSKSGALDSVIWRCDPRGFLAVRDICENNPLWKELRGLKQLWLEYMSFSKDVQVIHDTIYQQKNTLMVLCLPCLNIDWHKAKCHRSLALAIGTCKHLVKLNLERSLLTDSDLKIMLQDLPNLQILHLTRHMNYSHNNEITDKTCGLIARKCPGLQELNLRHHNQLSARGIRKIFEGCTRLRSFYTTTCKLSCGDVQELLDIAPQLLCLSLDEKVGFAYDDLDMIIEATGGRTLIRFSSTDVSYFYKPRGEIILAKTMDKYECNVELVRAIENHREDPGVMNMWEGLPLELL